MQLTRVTIPSIQLLAEPKSAAPVPPPKEAAPTERSENPIAVTTVAATIGEITFIQYFAKSPRSPSTIPPINTAPIRVPYPYCAPKVQARDTNVKLIPITIGSLEPILHIGNSCIKVPIPAIIIALWIIMAVSFAPSPQAAATIIIGVILATNIASMCCNPNGNAFNKLIFPSSEYNASTVSLFFFSLAIIFSSYCSLKLIVPVVASIESTIARDSS